MGERLMQLRQIKPEGELSEQARREFVSGLQRAMLAALIERGILEQSDYAAALERLERL